MFFLSPTKMFDLTSLDLEILNYILNYECNYKEIDKHFSYRFHNKSKYFRTAIDNLLKRGFIIDDEIFKLSTVAFAVVYLQNHVRQCKKCKKVMFDKELVAATYCKPCLQKMKMKYCPRCTQIKPISKFPKSSHYCTQCKVDYLRTRNPLKKEKERKRKWSREHKEYYREYRRKIYQKYKQRKQIREMLQRIYR